MIQPALNRHPQSPDETSQAIAYAEAICRTCGVRLTRIRRQVFKILLTSRKPLGAYRLADALGSLDGQRMAPITIYRALDFLIEQGLAHRLVSQNAYIASLGGPRSRETAAFLICDECGEVDEATSTELGGALSSLLESQGFRLRAKALEVTGRCARCQGTHRSAPRSHA